MCMMSEYKIFTVVTSAVTLGHQEFSRLLFIIDYK